MRDTLNKRDVWLLKKEDFHFKLFRDTLDARRKLLLAKGIGTTPKHADPVTEKDEAILWDTDTISTTTALGFSYGVYLYNCKIFGFRSKYEHVELQAEQYSFGTEDDGRQFVQYNGRLAKTITGSMECKATPRQIRHYAQPSNPGCVVLLLRHYLALNPPKGRFYRRPLPASRGNVGFSSQHIGVNKLSGMLAQMYVQAGIDTVNRNIRGHSGKVTCCTRLYDAELDDQAIKSLRGHRSNAVRAYKRPSPSLEQRISDALQPPMPKQHTSETSPSQEQDTMQKQEPQPSHSSGAMSDQGTPQSSHSGGHKTMPTSVLPPRPSHPDGVNPMPIAQAAKPCQSSSRDQDKGPQTKTHGQRHDSKD